jgi:fructose-1,6-bisphosphatase
VATNGCDRILDIVPEHLHQRTPLIVGSPYETEYLHAFARKELTSSEAN